MSVGDAARVFADALAVAEEHTTDRSVEARARGFDAMVANAGLDPDALVDVAVTAAEPAFRAGKGEWAALASLFAAGAAYGAKVARR